MAKTNYNKMANKSKEDVKVEKTSLDVEPVTNDEEVETITETVSESKSINRNKIGIVDNCMRLNVRTNPSINAAIDCVIEKGTEVEILGSHGDFYEVRENPTTKGFYGWCMKKYISVK